MYVFDVIETYANIKKRRINHHLPENMSLQFVPMKVRRSWGEWTFNKIIPCRVSCQAAVRARGAFCWSTREDSCKLAATEHQKLGIDS